jgi:two-component system, LytTR family, sensor kinase
MHSTRDRFRIIIIHVLFWLVYSISNAYLWYTFDKTYNDTTLYGLTRLPLKIAAVYANHFLLLQFFFKKKYPVFFSLFFLNLFLAGIVQTYISSPGLVSYQRFTQYALPIASVVIVSSVLIIIRQFFIKARESKQLEIEKIKTELNFLKAQLQPHFLFNTLNNIYSLTFNNCQLAGKSILQLSGLLRYMIYESETEMVDLQKEISHLKDYIELEKIRFATRMELSFNISGNVSGRKIIPILLIPFLENAFKHASNKINDKIWVTVDLIVKEDKLNFTVENSVFPEGKTQMHKPNSGIGLGNVKRRLSLLYENYTLKNEMKENYYHTFLQIPLR